MTPVFRRYVNRRISREIGYGAGGERLEAVLEGYCRFLIEKNLSSQKERPYLVRRVRESLLFA
mgnify:FL=1